MKKSELVEELKRRGFTNKIHADFEMELFVDTVNKRQVILLVVNNDDLPESEDELHLYSPCHTDGENLFDGVPITSFDQVAYSLEEDGPRDFSDPLEAMGAGFATDSDEVKAQWDEEVRIAEARRQEAARQQADGLNDVLKRPHEIREEVERAKRDALDEAAGNNLF